MKVNEEESPLRVRTLQLAKEIIERGIDPDVTSLNSFSKACKMSTSWIKTFNSNKFKTTTLETIQERFPMVNTEWLLNGEGNMFLESYEDISEVSVKAELEAKINILFSQVSQLLEQNKKLQEKIDQLEGKIG